MYVCPSDSIKIVRVRWVRTAHGMVCESHAPSTAVQWSQEELLRNVTAIRDGTAQAPAATAPLRSHSTGLCLATEWIRPGIQRGFSF